MNSLFFIGCVSKACQFDRTPTNGAIMFEVFVLFITVVLVWLIARRHPRQTLLKYFTLLMSVFIFEFFTSPMWNNFHMGSWAYVYRDVSWILTIGWATLLFTSAYLIERWLPKFSTGKRYLSSLVLATVAAVPFESFLVNAGIRSYSPEVLARVGTAWIPWLGIPWHALYYIPVFSALVMGLYHYFGFWIDKRPLVPVNKARIGRNFLLAVAGVFLFEVMIEPMVMNTNFPTWSYIYEDVSFLLTLGWVILIWLATTLVDRLMINKALWERFIGYLAVVGIVTLPIEAWLMKNGYRSYGASSVDNFSGITLPVFDVPVEVMFAIPLYLALIIGFLRFWETVLDNDL